MGYIEIKRKIMKKEKKTRKKRGIPSSRQLNNKNLMFVYNHDLKVTPIDC